MKSIMKRNLGCWLKNYKCFLDKKKIIMFLLMLFTIFQISVFIYLSLKKDNEKEVVTKILEDNHVININEINYELSLIDNIKINKQKFADEHWENDISLFGKKEDIIKSLKKISQYTITSFNIDGNIEKLHVNMEIFR